MPRGPGAPLSLNKMEPKWLRIQRNNLENVKNGLEHMKFEESIFCDFLDIKSFSHLHRKGSPVGVKRKPSIKTIDLSKDLISTSILIHTYICIYIYMYIYIYIYICISEVGGARALAAPTGKSCFVFVFALRACVRARSARGPGK